MTCNKLSHLVEALEILLKYGDKAYPTNCTHDTLGVDFDETIVSQEDIERLEELGFGVDEEYGGFYSFRFGSC